MSLSSAPRSRSLITALLVAWVVGACTGAATRPERSNAPSSMALAPSAIPGSPTIEPEASATDPVESAPPATGASAAASPVTPHPKHAAGAGIGAFAMDLYRPGDFVSEARTDWCVPAAIQAMVLMAGGSRSSLPSQRALNLRSRALSSSRLVGLGSEPQGWAGVLNRLGHGRYRVVAIRTFRAAVTAAARAIRATGRPVGLLVWHGAHAWVMSGFSASTDPTRASGFRVTSVRISDPWYPRTRGAYGRTHRPDSAVGLAELARNFVAWHRPSVRYAELDGRFVLVLPVG